MSKKKNNPYWDNRPELVKHESPFVLIKRINKSGKEVIESVSASEAKLRLGLREKETKFTTSIPRKFGKNNRKATPGRVKHAMVTYHPVEASRDVIKTSHKRKSIEIERKGVSIETLYNKIIDFISTDKVWSKGEIIKMKPRRVNINVNHGEPNSNKTKTE